MCQIVSVPQKMSASRQRKCGLRRVASGIVMCRRIEADELAELTFEAWRLIAPQSLVESYVTTCLRGS